MDSRPPISGSPPIPEKSKEIVVQNPLISVFSTDKLMFINNNHNGYDERYDNESDIEERIRICMLFYYYEQYIFLQTYKETNLEEVINNVIVQDVLQTFKISPIQITAGGLMDDWNRYF
jgi:hypothetical protein